MASPCPNCGYEFDQCMPWHPCPECGHARGGKWMDFDEPEGEWVRKEVPCKICKTTHTVTKFVEKLMVKNVG